LLWLSLILFAPIAQAHGGYHHQHDGVPSEHAQASDLSAAELPRGGGGGSPCCCDSPCCFSPDFAKLLAVSQARFFLLPSIQRPLQIFVADQTVWAARPIIALAAPRAPPLSL